MLVFGAEPRLEAMSVAVEPMVILPVEAGWDELFRRCAA